MKTNRQLIPLRILWWTTLPVGVILLAAGCSKEKKVEPGQADKLERKGQLTASTPIDDDEQGPLLPKIGDYPDRLTIICPRGPGGGSHQVAMAMATALEKVTGVPVDVVARGGRDGAEAIDFYTERVPPNGRVVLQHVDDAASMFVAGRSSVDPNSDLKALIVAQTTPSNLYVRANDKRFGDWKSFSEYFGAGSKNTLRIAMTGHSRSLEAHYVSVIKAALNRESGVEQRPFNGLGERYLALFDGRADALIEQPGDVRAYKAIEAIRELPSDEDKIRLFRFRAFFVHQATPDDRSRYLEEAFLRASQLHSFQKFKMQTSFDIGSDVGSDGAKSAGEWIGRQVEEYRNLEAGP